jgi:hypothetical protein
LPGTCSDTAITLQLDPDVGPIRYGVCASSNINDPIFSIPGCLYPTEYCPMGCCDYSILTPADCEESGGSWFRPLINESSCLSYSGCYEIDTNTVTDGVDIYRFSTKDDLNCVACSQSYSHWFTWSPATYLSGNYYPLSLINTNYGERFRWTDTLDFEALYDILLNASSTRQFILSQSESQCRLIFFILFIYFNLVFLS